MDNKPRIIKSADDRLMEGRAAPPLISDNMAKSVSQWRKDELERQVERGEFRDGNTPISISGGVSPAGAVTHSTSMKKYGAFADSTSGALSSGVSFRGAGGTVRQTPEVYSPLWLNSNLNLPRDRATINAWSRAFFALNPFVQNAIMLHATYPISKLNIRCKNKKVETFFSEMSEEIDLMNVCVQIAQEYWTLGEAFVYAELDESSAKWSRLVIQNPDYITVKRSVVAGEPLISLRPDENLRRVVFSNRPADVQQKRGLDPAIIQHVKRGENIPLNNFYVSHIGRRISPYEIRGTGLPVSVFRQLMLFDKLRECHSADTEVLTKDGFKKIEDLVELTNRINVKGEYVNGASLDNVGNINVLTLKDNVEVACYNNETNKIEHHKPEEFHMSKYKGPMLNFKGKKVDALVTANHKMLAAKKRGNEYGKFEAIRASEFEDKSLYKFKTTAEWEGNDCEKVEVCGKKMPTQLFVQFLGYLLSEGCIYSKLNKKTGQMQNNISISQLTASDAYPFMKDSVKKFAEFMDLHVGEYIKVRGNGFSKHTPKELWEARITNKELTLYFKNELGFDGKADSKHKRIPRWVLDLDKKYLMILLDALMYGDGSTKKIQQGISYRYCTACKELADDVQEAAFKCGYSPFVSTAQRKTCIEYTVRWSDSVSGREPVIYNNGDKCASINKIDYDGAVWCFTVPTGYFVTRRNNRISIHGNSKFAQADNLVNPITLVKIGDQEFRPSPADLEQYRQIFEECHDEETEVLTDQGFKKFDEVIEYQEVMDGTYDASYITQVAPKAGFKIACFNSDNEELEYHEPSAAHVYDHDGDMYHFHNDKMDIKVTSGHKMWVQKKKFTGTGKKRTWKWDKWDKVLAEDLYKKPWDKRFRTKAKWVGNDSIENVNVAGKEVKVELYLEFLGYFISEGHLGNGTKEVSLSQAILVKDGTSNEHYTKIRKCVEKFAEAMDTICGHSICNSNKEDSKAKYWNVRFSQKNGRALYEHLCNEIGTNDGHRSYNKIVPKWILELSPRLLQIFLDALVAGDGSDYERLVDKSLHGYFYYTTSKQLADDVYEVAYKAGYVPTLSVKDNEKYLFKYGSRTAPCKPCYTVQWSNSNIGTLPLVTRYSVDPRTKKKTEVISKAHYKGKVWCFTVPTGLFITRRNGKISIHSNSQYDKDFKIFTHQSVNIERIGAGQGIYDISGDITQLIKEIYIGLMVPQVLMDGGADVTYANGGVTLDVLRQRYMQFRNMISDWLKRKIFAPIAKLNEFYDVVDGKKVLVLPEVDWNHMSLFDAGDYINAISQLVSAQPKGVSYHTLYRSLGLDWDDEVSKKRIESIQQTIEMKEQEVLMQMPLTNLRAIAGKSDAEIKEVTPSPVPGEDPQVQPPGQQQGGMMPGAPPMGGMPPMGGGMIPPAGGPGGMPGGGAPPAGGAPPGAPPA